MNGKGIKVISYALTADFESEINKFINNPEVKIINISYSTASLHGYSQPVGYTAFIEYEKIQ